MTISKDETKKLTIKVKGFLLEQVKEFRYVGNILIEENRCQAKKKARTAMAKSAFSKKHELLTNSLSKDRKRG